MLRRHPIACVEMSMEFDSKDKITKEKKIYIYIYMSRKSHDQ